TRQVLRADRDGAAGGCEEATHDLEQHGLAGAVRPDDGTAVPFLDGQVDLGQQGGATELDGHVGQSDHWGHDGELQSGGMCRARMATPAASAAAAPASTAQVPSVPPAATSGSPFMAIAGTGTPAWRTKVSADSPTRAMMVPAGPPCNNCTTSITNRYTMSCRVPVA